MEHLLGAHGMLLSRYERIRAATDDPAAHLSWDPAGARAFLQRGEVRLSTVHRVAGVLLGGAGLLLLLPALLGQALPQLFGAFFQTWRANPIATACLAGVVGMLGVRIDSSQVDHSGGGPVDGLLAGIPSAHET